MISLSIHASRFFTKAIARDLSMPLTCRLTASGTGRSTISATHRSESSEPNERKASVWHHVPSILRHDADPSGFASMQLGQARSFARSPEVAPSASHPAAGGLPGRSSSAMARRRAGPSSGVASHRILWRDWVTSPRTRASLGTADSTSLAPTENVMYRERTRFETPSRILSLRIRLYSSASAAVLPLSAKKERCPISSAGMGVFTTES